VLYVIVLSVENTVWLCLSISVFGCKYCVLWFKIYELLCIAFFVIECCVFFVCFVVCYVLSVFYSTCS
jgi:hypothetical protein